jgi:predicted TIM-barrel fold metal-dependent hydrolase
MLNDAHCHFFSAPFFAALARQRGDRSAGGGDGVCRELGWLAPGGAEMLADQWVQALDAADVQRCALIASMPGDEESVARAVTRHPDRFIGFVMVDASAHDAVSRTTAALEGGHARAVCLFPAMHHVPLTDDRTLRVVEAAAAVKGSAVFVHCGVLSVGVRRKLGLASRFDLRLGDPLAVASLAMQFPETPFIIPHFGAGMFRETLMAADAAPNIYLDTSSSNSWIRYHPGLTLDAVFTTALQVVGASRLLFGTDSSFFPRGWQRQVLEQQQRALAAIGVPDADAALIFGGNFERLFA